MKQCKIILQQHKHLCILSFSALAFYAFSAVSMRSQAETFALQEQLPSQHTEYTIAGQETTNGIQESEREGRETQNGYRETKLDQTETFALKEGITSQHTEYTVAGQETKNGKRKIREQGHEVQNGYREVPLKGIETQNGYSSINVPSELA
ncbi:MAG: hypothetical protein Q3M24_10230 [Candidatus Electrothrix aestuarii]|uniref:Uncharacterized protein n=1 Tax=Candidatus Electrothrix aestuarii TaxID=3062594 RepID=A0AAU8M1V8_9BACT|nr:hypothetical protein [Candidatus Electrothrix aestuarii]